MMAFYPIKSQIIVKLTTIYFQILLIAEKSFNGSNSKQMGAYINDTSVQYQNCNMKKVVVDNKPCLCLFAIKDIKSGTELRYNYGDKADNLWWRTDKTLLQPYILSDGTCVPAISKQHSLKVSEVLKLMKNESLPVEKSKVVQNTSKVEFSSKSLNPPFIKIEDKSRLYRPMYKEEIESGFPLIFHLKESFQVNLNNETITKNCKSYCECCEVKFEDLKLHLNGNQHRQFALNSNNYAGVDDIIKSFSFEKFLLEIESSLKHNVTLSSLTSIEETHVHSDNKHIVSEVSEISSDFVDFSLSSDKEKHKVNEYEKVDPEVVNCLSIAKNENITIKKTIQREKKMCPECSANVYNIPRHLQGKPHYWSKEKALAAISIYGLRKKKILITERKSKSYHRKRTCPISSCSKVILHLNEHLLKVHKLPRNSQYYTLLKDAKVYVESSQNQINNYGNIEKISTAAKQINEKREQVQLVHNHNKNSKISVLEFNLDEQFKTDQPQTELQCAQYEQNQENHNNESDLEQYSDFSDSLKSDDSEYIPDEILEPKCGPFVEGLFAQFHKFMIGPDRGRKELSIQSVVGNVRRIFEIIGVNNDLRIVFLDISKSVRDKYLTTYCVEKSIKPGAIKTYLYSLKDFCDFLLAENIFLEGITNQHISEASMKLDQWRKKYKAHDKVQKHIRAEEDFEMLITSEQVSLYENSQFASNARNMIKSTENLPFSPTDYCCVRDHLLTILIFSNAPRSGVLARMTVTQFEKAVISDNRAVISVKDHKTFSTYGAAKIQILEEHYKWVNTFIKKFRACLPIQCDNVFLARSGRPLSPGDISKRLDNLWRKCRIFNGRVIPKHLSANIVRKSASTNLREANSKFVKEAAKAMMHSDRTAEEHYAIPNMVKSVKSGLEEIRQQFYRCTTPNDISLKTDDAVNKDPSMESHPLIGDNTVHQKLEKKETINQTSNIISTITTPHKKAWLPDEIKVLKEVFPSESPSVKEIKKVHSHLNIDASPIQIYNKFSSIRRYSPHCKVRFFCISNFSQISSQIVLIN
ncbi:uncharacterized protein LOC124814412 isoform X1 [Hydra vulgaris]|uniref:uncharacterized protein LOC124814412 isoform X1 n=1 Tax=Hydra vulgaris TaxID=6087 RepID=UPI0032EA535C